MHPFCRGGWGDLIGQLDPELGLGPALLWVPGQKGGSIREDMNWVFMKWKVKSHWHASSREVTRSDLCVCEFSRFVFFDWSFQKLRWTEIWVGLAQELGALIGKWGTRDLPGGPVVKNLPSNSGDSSSVPGRGTKIPHAAERLESPPLLRSPHALEPVLCSKRSPRATTGESLSTAMKTPFTKF